MGAWTVSHRPTSLGDQGIRLSGGQRQQLAGACALVISKDATRSCYRPIGIHVSHLPQLLCLTPLPFLLLVLVDQAPPC